jgi:hypothetical protein
MEDGKASGGITDKRREWEVLGKELNRRHGQITRLVQND